MDIKSHRIAGRSAHDLFYYTSVVIETDTARCPWVFSREDDSHAIYQMDPETVVTKRKIDCTSRLNGKSYCYSYVHRVEHSPITGEQMYIVHETFVFHDGDTIQEHKGYVSFTECMSQIPV